MTDRPADATDEDSILGIRFQKIDSMKAEDLDALPFGAIQLDAEGKVRKYNMFESKLANLPQGSVLGKHFFRQVAPCTDVKVFHGRFLEGVARKKLHARFNYHFSFKHAPRDVSVTLIYSDTTQSVWVFVQPR